MFSTPNSSIARRKRGGAAGGGAGSERSAAGGSEGERSNRSDEHAVTKQRNDTSASFNTTFASAQSNSAASLQGKKRSSWVNLSVPQPSYAYGAPSDDRERNSKITGRPTSISPGPGQMSYDEEGQQSATNANGSQSQTAAESSLPAKARYAELKKRREAAAALAAEAHANRSSASNGARRKKATATTDVVASPVRRSARLSDAGSQAGSISLERRMDDDDLDESHRTHVSETQFPGHQTIEEEAEDDEDEEEEGVRHSQTSEVEEAARHQPISASAPVHSPPGQARGQERRFGTGLHSFFMRAGSSLSPSGANSGLGDMSLQPADGMGIHSTLLRGAQKPSHDPMALLPPRGASSSVGPSGLEDSTSYDYAAEDALARDLEQRLDDTGSRSKSWMSALRSPWSQSAASAPPEMDSEAPRSNGILGDASLESQESTRTATRKRRGRPSKDSQTYRPDPQDFETEDDDNVSDGGQKHTHRRRARGHGPAGMQGKGGRDDNRIWTTKKRKGARRKSAQGAHESDSSEDDEDQGKNSEQEQDDEGHQQADETADTSRSAAKSPRKARGSTVSRYQASWSSALAARVPAVMKTVLWTSVVMAITSVLVVQVQHGGILAEISRARTSFTAPEMAPSDLQSLLSRFRKLESAVAGLDRLDGNVKTVQTELQRARQDLSKRISALESSSTGSRKTIEGLERKSDDLRRELDRSIDSLRVRQQDTQAEIDKLRDTFRSPEVAGGDQGTTSQEGKELRSRIAKLEDTLGKSSKELARLVSAQSKLEKGQTEVEARIGKLADHLPAQMPVRKDLKTGHLHVDPTFWTEAKKVLTPTNPSWDDFRKANEGALRSFLRDEVARRDGPVDLDARETLVSRDDFRALLDSELAVLKAELASKFNENLDGVKDEMWEKIRRTGEAYQTSGSISSGVSELLGKLDGSGSGSGAAGSGSDQVLALIEAALDKYSADRLSRQDFALYTAGGRILPSLTSPTYEIGSPRSWTSIVPGLREAPLLKGRAPVVAIHHDNSPGMCWAFAGNSGQLGVVLSHDVIVSDITIEHAPPSLVGASIASAPREVVVWGLVQRASDRSKLAEYRAKAAADPDAEPTPSPPADHLLYLGSYLYDIGPNSRAIQTYPVPADIRALGIATSILRFRFTSNHGNRDFTCVYRVRVHGDSTVSS